MVQQVSAADADSVMPEGISGMSFLDDVPQTGNPGPSGILACKVCDTPLTYGGRGPKPQYCDEHKRSSRNPNTRTTGGASTNALIERAILQLDAGYRMIAAASKFVAGEEVAGQVNEKSGELAESWRSMLEVNKKFRDSFAKVEKSAAWLPVVMVHGDLIASIMMSRQMQRMLDKAQADMRRPATVVDDDFMPPVPPGYGDV